MANDKPIGKWLDRAEFVKARYDLYVIKKELLFKTMPNDSYVMADLDSNFKPGMQLKELVLCDRCNENIESDQFFMLEDSMCYHEKCIKKDSFYFPNPATRFPIGAVLDWSYRSAHGKSGSFPVLVVAHSKTGRLHDMYGEEGHYFVATLKQGSIHAAFESDLRLSTDLGTILEGKRVFPELADKIVGYHDLLALENLRPRR